MENSGRERNCPLVPVFVRGKKEKGAKPIVSLLPQMEYLDSGITRAFLWCIKHLNLYYVIIDSLFFQINLPIP